MVHLAYEWFNTTSGHCSSSEICDCSKSEWYNYCVSQFQSDDNFLGHMNIGMKRSLGGLNTNESFEVGS